MNAFPHLCRLLFLAVVALALAGCGGSSDSDRSHVYGDVSFGGEPVDDGGIAFIPEGAGPAQVRATGEIRDGHYDLDSTRGPYPGKYKVEIYWNKKTGRKITSKSGNASRDETKQAIPEKYNEKTELRADIKPGRNELNFPLKK
jgi:hypothetical protein